MSFMCGEKWLETGSPFVDDTQKGNNMNNESFYMHPRFDEFTAFLKTLNTDAKITPNSLNLAFDVWLEIGFVKNIELLNENTILKAKADVFLKSCKAWEDSNEILKADLDRLHRERDSFQEQARALAEEVERLSSMLVLAEAIGERGHACMSVDGGNL